jgi:3-oxoacyl-[acyl-carrier protein] reductase
MMGNAGQANYSAAKAGVIGLTKTTARELASRGVRCNAVAPGFIETDMTAKLSDSVREALMGEIALGRLGRPEDVASAVVFLAGDNAAYVTGQTLAVDGGMTFA